MPGSPIIQDRKLIGAVTGYGIFIENMLDAAGATLDNETAKSGRKQAALYTAHNFIHRTRRRLDSVKKNTESFRKILRTQLGSRNKNRFLAQQGGFLMDYYKVPIGFGMALAMNPPALNAYSAMTEDEKQQILHKAHNARSEKEMHDIVNHIAGFKN